MSCATFQEVFSNNSGVVYQCDLESCFYVEFEGKRAKYSVRNLMQLKRKLDHFKIEEIFAVDSLNPSGVEIVTISTTNYCYILNPLQIIRFRELLDQTFFNLHVNQVLKDCLQYAVLA
ncbi:hypothetical protein BCY91_04385 [Pelobium manganitolerans]|uniref:Uncharacterized protein n=1 Tax=Pelobium manganitolerans TaxID=1842495 RepID=A0A419S5K3_9SPHI|nr:hypothetical protein [Pelobium manganitolerans]RKD16130.1 hypothetical protein BCY91_04385 [Pelobium manganitolerans]